MSTPDAQTRDAFTRLRGSMVHEYLKRERESLRDQLEKMTPERVASVQGDVSRLRLLIDLIERDG